MAGKFRVRIEIERKPFFPSIFDSWVPGNRLFFSTFQSMLGNPLTVKHPWIWPKKKLMVCFVGGDEAVQPPAAKQIIKAAAVREFTSQRTGLTFGGFEDCDKLEMRGFEYDIRIMKGLGIASNASISLYKKDTLDPIESFNPGVGYSVAVKDEKDHIVSLRQVRSNEKAIINVMLSWPSVCEENKVNFNSCIEIVTLHELGHSAGLRHEHIRPEASTDPNCALKTSRESIDAEPFVGATSASRPYDPLSIMNYCRIASFREGKWKPDGSQKWRILSSGDASVLKAYYR